MRPPFALALLLLSSAGCARRVGPPPSQPPGADEALSRMRATFACAHAIQADAKIDHFGEQGRVRGDLMLFAARPAQVRMDIVSPFGVALYTLTSDGARFALDDLRAKRFLVGSATPCNIARLTTLPVPGHVLVDLLQGAAPVLVHAPGAAGVAWNADGYFAVTIASTRAAREEIHLVPRPDDWNKPWQDQRMRVLDVRVEQAGYVLYRAEMSDHAAAPTAGPREDPDALGPPLPPSGPPCDAEVPRKIHLEVPDPEADVRFQYHEITWNPPLPEGTFDQQPPAGVRVEPVSCD